jgi:ABC-type uncharacterized transport system YnjBCD ATPase subunit
MSSELAARVRLARRAADMDAGQAVQVGKAGKRAEAEVAALRGQIELHERVSRLLTTIGEQRQENMQREIEDGVTRGLQVIFGEELSFHIVTSVKNNSAQVDFMIRSVYDVDDGKGGVAPLVVDTPVMEARGGGMVAVVGFVLRLVLLLKTPGARRVLLLDESFAHVSREYEPRVAEFLSEVSKNAGVQIILITHSDAFSDVADQRYHLALESGVTVVRQEG